METELQEFYNNQVDPEYVHNKLVDLEDRSKRCSLRIDGVTERNDETQEQCEGEIQNIKNIKNKNIQNIGSDSFFELSVNRCEREKRQWRLIQYIIV